MYTARSLAPIQRPIKGIVNEISAGKDLKIDLPVGLTYLNTEIEAKIGGSAGTAPTRAEMISMWTRIRVLLDGEPRMDLPMSEYLDMIEYYRGTVVGATGYLPIIQEMLWNEDPTQGGNPLAAKINPAWGTKNHGSLVVEIVQDATSTIDYVDVHADLQPQGQDLGLHFRMVRQTCTFNAVGICDYTIPFWERGSDPGYLYGIHILPPTLAKLKYIRLFADGAPIVEGSVEQLHRRLLQAPHGTRRTIQTGWAHLDRCWRNFDQDAMPWNILDQQLMLQMEFITTAPGTFPIHLHVASPDTRPPSVAA